MLDHDSTRDDLVRELKSARKQLAEIRAIESKQEQLREALAKDRERYQKIFHGSNDAIFVIDADRDLVLDVNPKACEILGYSRRELLSKAVTDIHPQEMPQFRAFASRVMEDGSGWTDELTCMTKAGQSLQAEISASTIEFEGRTCVIAMVRDISERKRAERAIKTSEEKYRSLYHHTPVMMHSINRSGKLIRVNHFWLSVLGYQRDEVIGRQVMDFLTDRYRKLAATVYLPKLLQTGTVTDVELQMVKSDGSVIDALLSAVAIRDDAGEMDHSVAFVIDVTESKAAARALMESEERLSRILESAMDAIITIDDDRRIVLFNAAAEKTFLGSRADVLDQRIDLFLAEKFRNLLTNCLKDFHRRKKNRPYIWAPEGLTAIRSNREEFPVEATISHVRVSDRNLYTIILRDINERLRAEAELRKLHLQNIYLQEEIETEFNFGEIVGASAAMKKVFRNIEKVAPTDSTVLITGETGTGKELVARAIHNTSTRRGVLIKVNCGALPSGLVESELFGHEKGAFTGAVGRKKGRFELADAGTVFLDEVGELPLETQIKLLRVLQEQEFERVGGTETIKVNVRVIAASNRDLEEAIKQGVFRSDLFYRLNIFPIQVPALRERSDDVALLTNYFVNKFATRMGKRIETLSSRTLAKLKNYAWPGNVRELANIVERAVILCEAGQLLPEHLSIAGQEPAQDLQIPTLEDAERGHILRALTKTDGVIGGERGAAKLLGINRSTLLSRMKRLGISKRDIYSP